MEVRVTDPDENIIQMTFNPSKDGVHGNQAADAVLNGKKVDFSSLNIYSGPYVYQVPGLLNVSDGDHYFEIDFTGDIPVYSDSGESGSGDEGIKR